MIAVQASVVAHLGGPRGDRLSISRDAGPFRAIADLGWDRRTQITPQRRLLLTGDSVFVLEPKAGPMLAPPLRVRRLDLSGRELDRQEGAGTEGDADLYFIARREGRDSPIDPLVRCYGIDAATGSPLRWEATLETSLVRLRRDCSGVPLRRAGTWWFPIREEGLVRVDETGVEQWRGKAGPEVRDVSGRAVCAARSGAWIDGAWHPFSGPELFPPWRAPRNGNAARSGDGIALLRTAGGELPTIGAPPVRLPRGCYGGLAALPQGLFGIAEERVPRLVLTGP